jgi:hypothetical protein
MIVLVRSLSAGMDLGGLPPDDVLVGGYHDHPNCHNSRTRTTSPLHSRRNRPRPHDRSNNIQFRWRRRRCRHERWKVGTDRSMMVFLVPNSYFPFGPLPLRFLGGEKGDGGLVASGRSGEGTEKAVCESVLAM